MKRATVYWCDAHSSQVDYDAAELDRRHRPVHQATTGWVFKNDRVGVTLVMVNKLDKENAGMGLYDFRLPFFIPRACIQRIEWLEPK